MIIKHITNMEFARAYKYACFSRVLVDLSYFVEKIEKNSKKGLTKMI